MKTQEQIPIMNRLKTMLECHQKQFGCDSSTCWFCKECEDLIELEEEEINEYENNRLEIGVCKDFCEIKIIKNNEVVDKTRVNKLFLDTAIMSLKIVYDLDNVKIMD